MCRGCKSIFLTRFDVSTHLFCRCDPLQVRETGAFTGGEGDLIDFKTALMELDKVRLLHTFVLFFVFSRHVDKKKRFRLSRLLTLPPKQYNTQGDGRQKLLGRIEKQQAGYRTCSFAPVQTTSRRTFLLSSIHCVYHFPSGLTLSTSSPSSNKVCLSPFNSTRHKHVFITKQIFSMFCCSCSGSFRLLLR